MKKIIKMDHILVLLSICCKLTGFILGQSIASIPQIILQETCFCIETYLIYHLKPREYYNQVLHIDARQQTTR